MTARAHRWFDLWRRRTASVRGRALVGALALAVFGWQLALQGHVLGHDLESRDATCVYALQVNQLTPVTPDAPRVALDPQRHATPESFLADLAIGRAPLVERARGPPAHLA